MVEDIYWKKYAQRYRIFEGPEGAFSFKPELIICIPVYAEPNVLTTVNSLLASNQAGIPTGIILLFNQNSLMTDEEKQVHHDTWEQCRNIKLGHQEFQILPVWVEAMPAKGGVGWARKLAMDQAARWLDQDGIIVCLDADCTVAANYIDAIYTSFRQHPDRDAASIYFEHDIQLIPETRRNAIVAYELHLRYLIEAQRWCGHPFGFHTVGSSMAVRRKGYLAQGGMNTRSAGEDYYFLQKFIETGLLFEINTTTVYPSSRISSRVPFGTGRAMFQILGQNKEWLTIDFHSFELIKPLFEGVNKIYNCFSENGIPAYDLIMDMIGIEPVVCRYLADNNFMDRTYSIYMETSDYASFKKRFFRSFNSFWLMKYLHHLRVVHPDVQVMSSVRALSAKMNFNIAGNSIIEDYLIAFRNRQRRPAM